MPPQQALFDPQSSAELTHDPSTQRETLHGSPPTTAQSMSPMHGSGQHSPTPQQTEPAAQATVIWTQTPSWQRDDVQGSIPSSGHSASDWQPPVAQHCPFPQQA
jgi:hypothetical protein